ncbi:nitronate monooxygenase family protein [Mycoplasmatota bacterium WC44]
MKIPTFTINGKEVKIPIIQGGMGIKISLNKLASACINSNIVGTISAAQTGFQRYVKGKKDNFYNANLQTNKEALKEEISKVRENTKDGILGVNLMTAGVDFDEFAKFLAKQDIDFIVSGAGLPMELPKHLVDSNVKPAAIISSGRAAKVILRNWDRKFNVVPEFLVVEGPLAGGHLGFTKEEIALGNVKELEELVVEVLKVVKPFEEKYNKKIPVIAAGGIHTGEDIARFIGLGSSGVQMATRFIATHECDVHENYKQKIVDAKEEDIVATVSPAGLPGRAIRNKLTEFVKNNNLPIKTCVDCLRSCSRVNIPYCITEKLGESTSGDVENGLVFTGAKAYMIDRLVSVQELVDELVSELKLKLQEV